MMSGSIDYSNKMFSLNQNSGRYEYLQEVKYHEGFVFDVIPMVSGLGFFSAGRDKKIMAISLEGNPVHCYTGHEDGVNSLS